MRADAVNRSGMPVLAYPLRKVIELQDVAVCCAEQKRSAWHCAEGGGAGGGHPGAGAGLGGEPPGQPLQAARPRSRQLERADAGAHAVHINGPSLDLHNDHVGDDDAGNA